MDEDSPQVIAQRIKSVHAQLRAHWRRAPSQDDVWRAHTSNQGALAAYARDMHTLASQHWSQDDPNSRTIWIHRQISNFYHGGQRESVWLRIARKSGRPSPRHASHASDPLQVLDVGSCYNPLAPLAPTWQICALDIAPAADQPVRACDFLSVPLVSDSGWTWTTSDQPLTQLPLGHFDAVVFSLLLEYLPAPRLRYEASRRAHRVLRSGGILVIVTPDSSHQAKNFALIRLWRMTLAGLGFTRVTYEKLAHLTGLVFMKLDHHPDLLQREAQAEAARLNRPDLATFDPVHAGFIIPQDQNTPAAACEPETVTPRHEAESADLFSHLPWDL